METSPQVFCIEERIDAAYLRTFQSTLLHHESSTREFSKIKKDLLDTAADLNFASYREMIGLLSAYEHCRSLVNKDAKPERRMICANIKDYLGSTYAILKTILFTLRDDPQSFHFLAKAIERDEKIPGAYLKHFAEDIVSCFFFEPSSATRGETRLLKLFDYLLKCYVKEDSEGVKSRLFEDEKVICRLIRAYSENFENMGYVHLLFKKIVEQHFSLSSSMKDLKLKREGSDFVHKLLKNDASTEAGTAFDECGSASPTTRLNMDHFSPMKRAESHLAREEIFKVVFEENDFNILAPDEFMAFADRILKSMKKKLFHMPLGMRYVCKMAEKYTESERGKYPKRRAVMGILYSLWLHPALVSPAESGLIRPDFVEERKMKQLNHLLRALKSLLFEEQIEGSPQFVKEMSMYSASKKEFLDAYVDELLEISLPDSESESEAQTQVKDGLSINSVCISIEDFKFIQDVLYSNIKDLTVAKETLSKYIKRLKSFVESQDNKIFSQNIFKVTEQAYHPEIADGLGPISKEEFISGYHYIEIQELEVKEEKRDILLSSKWQQCLHNLFTEIDLTIYCNKQISPGTEQNELFELLQRVCDFPSAFVTDPNKEVRIKLLANYLQTFFKGEGAAKSKDALMGMCDEYDESLSDNLEKKKVVSYMIRTAINSIDSSIDEIKRQIRFCNNVQRLSVVAHRFIEAYKCGYEIEKKLSPSQKIVDKKAKSVIAAYQLDSAKFVITFDELPAPEKARKSITGRMSLSSKHKIVKGKLASETSFDAFLDEYCMYIEASRLVENGEDFTQIQKVFRDYYERMRDVLFSFPQIADLPEESKERVYNLIYSHSTRKVFEKIFPQLPTEEDLKFTNILLKLKETAIGAAASHSQKKSWSQAIKKLRSVFKVSTPDEMLVSMAEAYRIILDTVSVFSLFTGEQAEESNTRVVKLVLIQAMPDRMISAINYIEWYRNWRLVYSKDIQHHYMTIRDIIRGIVQSETVPKIARESILEDYISARPL